ncbi:hypothetical protein [Calothrix rhizosoleniae]|uniref:hypothetical protein n=1 Tax=Calothrix rhizosoleniae TaxID=888997 RepID=UPI000B49915B|nr:hypothetical protein [Calothrix rhizosoleniae]
MDLDIQIQSLIDDAPQDGVTPQLIAIIAPVLNAIAQQLRHHQYYILQNLQESWVVTTLSNRTNSTLQKRVIYAFPTLQDVATGSSSGLDAQVTAMPIPVIHILFQLVALESVDSIVFLETPGTDTDCVEILRAELQKKIQKQLKSIPPNRYNSPDIA